jgi:hypothetical protein
MRRATLFSAVICAIASAGCGSAQHATTATTARAATTTARSTADPVTSYRRQLLAIMTAFQTRMTPIRNPAGGLADAAIAQNFSDRQDVYLDTVARMRNLDPPARFRRLHRAAIIAFDQQYTDLGRCQQPLGDVLARDHTESDVTAVVKRCLRPLARHSDADKAAVQALMDGARVPFTVT